MKKLLVRIFNLVYLAGAALAVVGLAARPLVNVELSIEVPGQFITEIVQKEVNGDENEHQEERVYLPHITRDEVNTDQFDLKEMLSKLDMSNAFKGLAIEAKVKLPSLFDFLKLDAAHQSSVFADALSESIENIKDSLSDVLTEGLEKLVPEVAKAAASTVISQSISNEIKEALGKESVDDPAVKEQFEKVEEKVNELVDEVWNKLTEEEATVDTVFEVVEDKVNEVFDVLKESDPEQFGDIEISETQLEEIKDSMTDMLQQVGLADEDGNIQDIDAALAMMLQMFTGGSTEDDEEDEGTETKAYVVRAEEADSETKQQIKEFIDKLLADLPMDKIASFNLDEMVGVENLTLYSYIGLVGLAALPWLLFALITIIRTIRKNKCWTKPWVVFVFAFLELILGIVLFAGLKYGVSAILGAVGGSIPTEYAGLLTAGGVTLSVKFSCLIASLVYVVMIPLTIVYMIIARGVKKDYKEQKKNKKAA